jgi:hypothetical protein
MWVFDSERRQLPSHHGARRATRCCRAAAGACFALLLAASEACIEQGPLFSDDDISVDAGAGLPPALGGSGNGGALGEPPFAPPSIDERPPYDAGLLPTEGPSLPNGPISAPGCEASDGGSAANCENPPEVEPPDVEPPDVPDACDVCLADVCPADVERCDDIEGCDAIVACARSSGCLLDACYCGTVNDLLCTTTAQANGPCRDVMLAAPGAHPPNLVDPTAGPAAAAARALGQCRLDSDDCRAVCDG